MWVCPQCGRTFKKTKQAHYCGEKPKTIADYIARQSEDIQVYLIEIRKTLKDALPDAQERISWSMPTYWHNENIIHFAAHKKHVGIYAGEEAVVAFQDELKNYKTSKGTIQFQYHEPIPYELIAKIARWCYETGNHA